MPTLREVRDRRVVTVALAATVVAVVVQLLAARSLNFAGDDWDILIGTPHATIRSLLEPRGGHWQTTLILVYEALFRAWGLRSYLPYMAVLALLNGVSALLTFALVRRHYGDALGLFALLVMLFFGNGADDMLWAVNISYVASVAAGMGALLLLDRRRGMRDAIAAAVLLSLGVMSSGFGLFFLLAAAARAAAQRQARQAVVPLLFPGLLFVAWYLAVGHAGSGLQSGASLAGGGAIAPALAYAATGISATAVGVLGLYHGVVHTVSGLLLFTVLAVCLGLAWRRRRRVDALALGALFGLAAQFLLTGLVRQGLGIDEAASSRYLYPAAPFVLLLTADLLHGIRLSPVRSRLLAAVGAVAVIGNAAILGVLAVHKTHNATFANAELQTVQALRGTPGMDLDVHLDQGRLGNLSARQYYRLVDLLGAPVPVVPGSEVARLPATPVDAVSFRLLGRGYPRPQP